MYTTKLKNSKASPFAFQKGTKEYEKQEKEAKNIFEADKKYAERYGAKKKVAPTELEQKRRKNFSIQPPLKGMTTGYFGSLDPKAKTKGEDHAKSYKEQQLTYFKNSYDKYQGAPFLAINPSKGDGKTASPVARKPRAFGSNDVHRSAEFCNGIRQSQWKELLSTEAKFQTQWSNQAAAARGIDSVDQLLEHPNARAIKNKQENEDRAARGLPEFFQTQVPGQLYDVGKTNEHPPCYRCKSNRFYCPHRVRSGIINNRRAGGGEYKLMSGEIGGRVWGVSSKPAHGRVSTIKQFNDISHL